VVLTPSHSFIALEALKIDRSFIAGRRPPPGVVGRTGTLAEPASHRAQHSAPTRRPCCVPIARRPRFRQWPL